MNQLLTSPHRRSQDPVKPIHLLHKRSQDSSKPIILEFYFSMKVLIPLLSVLPSIVSVVPLQKISIAGEWGFEGLSSALNHDVTTLISEFHNPKVLSLEESATALPEYKSFQRERHTWEFVKGKFIFGSKVLQPGTFYTLHVTGDDRKYLQGKIKMKFIKKSGTCRDIGIFTEELTEVNVFNRHADIPMKKSITFELNAWDTSLPLGTRVALFIPPGCTVTLKDLKRYFDFTQQQRETLQGIENLADLPLIFSKTEIFPSIPVEDEVLTVEETEALFPKLEIQTLRDGQAPLYKYNAPRNSRIQLPQGKFLTIPGKDVIGYDKCMLVLTPRTESCTEVKLYSRQSPEEMKEMIYTPNRFISYNHLSSGNIVIKLSEKDYESNGYHFHIPKGCELSIASIESFTDITIQSLGQLLLTKTIFERLPAEVEPAIQRLMSRFRLSSEE